MRVGAEGGAVSVAVVGIARARRDPCPRCDPHRRRDQRGTHRRGSTRKAQPRQEQLTMLMNKIETFAVNNPARRALQRYGETPMLRRLGGRTPSADRKSTRLNSSHVAISYAVFCLK